MNEKAEEMTRKFLLENEMLRNGRLLAFEQEYK